MIDPERILVIFLGSLTAALLILSVALVSDVNWHWWVVQLRRMRRYWIVTYQRRTTKEERLAVVYAGRFVWAWVLAYAALKGW